MATYRIDVRFAEFGRQRAAQSSRPAELERVKLWLR